jgi:hypothetical protein
MRYFVSLVACHVHDDGKGLEVASGLGVWHGNEADIRRDAKAETLRRWPKSEGWRGHTSLLFADPEHVHCTPDPLGFMRAVYAKQRGRRAAAAAGQVTEMPPAEVAPVETEAQELETIA